MDGCSSLNLKAFTKILKKFVKVRHNILPTSEHIDIIASINHCLNRVVDRIIKESRGA
jgi:hypothetical protein